MDDPRAWWMIPFFPAQGDSRWLLEFKCFEKSGNHLVGGSLCPCGDRSACIPSGEHHKGSHGKEH